MADIPAFVSELDDNEIWQLYSLSAKELRKRGLVRTNNIVGERGEQIAIKIYNSTPNEPKLKIAQEGTQNVDAISRKGDRYSIKTIKYPSKTTGVFWGLNPLNSEKADDKKFEYIIIVILDEDLQPEKILELDWNTFIRFKKWHSRMKAWNLSLTKNLEAASRTVYTKK